MKDLELLMMLLPVAFMIHEYEEIIMFKGWLTKNRIQLKRRFPKIATFMEQHHVFDLSTSSFAVGTAHNFVLISTATFAGIWLEAYQWWWVALVGHTAHLVVHLAQWAIYRRHLPVIATTILTLPYCIYAGFRFTEQSALSPESLLLWSILGIIVMLLSVLSSWLLMSKFNKWEKLSKNY